MECYYAIGSNIFDATKDSHILDKLPERLSNIKIFENIYKEKFLENNDGYDRQFDEHIQTMSPIAEPFDDVIFIPINKKNKIQFVKKQMIDWLQLHNVECNYYNIDLISSNKKVITRNCELDRMLINNEINRLTFHYYIKLHIIIRSKGSVSHKPIIEFNVNPDTTLQYIIHKSLFKGDFDLLKSNTFDKIKCNYLKYYEIYDYKFHKLANYNDSVNIKLKDFMEFAGGELYLNQIMYDLEPVYIKSDINFHEYVDKYSHIYTSELTLNEYFKYMIDPIFKNTKFSKIGHIKILDIKSEDLKITLNEYVKKYKITDRIISLNILFTNKKMKKKRKNRKTKSIDNILAELLTEFGTCEDFIINEKLNSSKLIGATFRHNNIHKIEWKISDGKKTTKQKIDNSTVKININIPLIERGV